MECVKINKKLSAYLDKALKKEEMQEAFEHLERCNSCQKEFQILTNNENILNELGEISPSADFRQRLWEKVEKEKAKKWSWNIFMPFIPELSPITVSMVIFLGFLTAFSLFSLEKNNEEKIRNAYLFDISLKNFTETAPGSFEEIYLKQVGSR